MVQYTIPGPRTCCAAGTGRARWAPAGAIERDDDAVEVWKKQMWPV